MVRLAYVMLGVTLAIGHVNAQSPSGQVRILQGAPLSEQNQWIVVPVPSSL